MTDIDTMLQAMRRRFAEAGLADGAIEARILLAGLLELSPTDLVLKGDQALNDDDIIRIEAAIERRIGREPVHRILGHRAFHALDLALSPETLEPRPDTEILVEAAAHLARERLADPNRSGPLRILDLGTGTGAVGLALLLELPDALACLTDLSDGALQTARSNAERHGLADRAEFAQGSWFDAVKGRFDLVVSNPPYIATEVIHGLEPEVTRFDPMAALDGGPDGLDAYRAIASGVDEHLDAGGVIALEIGFDQAEAVKAVFAAEGFSCIQTLRDYGGNDRVVVFRRAD